MGRKNLSPDQQFLSRERRKAKERERYKRNKEGNAQAQDHAFYFMESDVGPGGEPAAPLNQSLPAARCKRNP